MFATRSFYNLGIYKTEWADSWPWHFHYENGVYLSRKYRPCGWAKAAEFECPQEAREFFHSWKNTQGYQLELIEFKRRVEIPDPVFPEDHPRTILDKINKNEQSCIRITAMSWFSGDDISDLWTKRTLNKHRAALLNYGIDIFETPTSLLEPLPSMDDDEWHLAKNKLNIIT